MNIEAKINDKEVPSLVAYVVAAIVAAAIWIYMAAALPFASVYRAVKGKWPKWLDLNPKEEAAQ